MSELVLAVHLWMSASVLPVDEIIFIPHRVALCPMDIIQQTDGPYLTGVYPNFLKKFKFKDIPI